LFTTLIALFVLGDRNGFSIGIGTTAGSALFNGMIIPAACILSVIGAVIVGVRVTSVNVSSKVLLRDGLSLIACEIVLILLINGQRLYWWQGLILIGLYVAYLTLMLTTMKTVEDSASKLAHSSEEHGCGDESTAPPRSRNLIGNIFYWLSLGPIMDWERWFVREHHRKQMADESWNGWPLLLASTGVIGLACWLLVKSCEWLGTGSVEHPSYTLFGWEFQGLGMPAMFVAVIFASMATSVPDTIMSIRDARDGDYDDAVANALGSNVFDICFALGFPLFLFTIIHGPIEMSPEVAAQSGELRLLLLFLTIVGFFIYFVGKRGKTPKGMTYVEMKRGKAVLLLTMYALFVVYIVGLSQQWALSESISYYLRSTLKYLPHL
jgi:Ca2+/Na+ antiporter